MGLCSPTGFHNSPLTKQQRPAGWRCPVDDENEVARIEQWRYVGIGGESASHRAEPHDYQCKIQIYCRHHDFHHQKAHSSALY